MTKPTHEPDRPNSLRKRAGRIRRSLHAFAMWIGPRAMRDRLKRALDAVGLLVWYWRAKALASRLARPFVPRRIAATIRFVRAMRATAAARRAEPRLTVAVDISPLWEPLTGIGWYLYRLLEHLADRDDVRLRLYGPNLVSTPDLPPPVVPLPSGPALEEVRYEVGDDLAVSYVSAVVWLRRLTARLIAADGNQILFAPNYFLPTWFFRARGRLVATVHDLSFLRVPWTMRETTRENLETHLRSTVERASLVLTDAETVRGELIDSGLVAPERVCAVALGPGAATAAGGVDTPLPAGVPADYVLHVGTLEPRKDLPTLLAAWRLLRARTSALPLVLCGRLGWKTEELEKAIREGVAEGWLVHLGYLEDAQVAALYRHATLVVMPSIYEGFGLPAVEAMCLGAPLLVSDIPVLREVAGDAAVYAQSGEPEDWCQHLTRLLADADARAELIARGRQRSARFTWRRTADETVAVWQHAAAGSKVVPVRMPEAQVPEAQVPRSQMPRAQTSSAQLADTSARSATDLGSGTTS